MLKDDNKIGQIEGNFKKEIIKPLSIKSKNIKKDLRIQVFRLIINMILSIILIVIFIYAWITYNPQWRIFFYLASWSYLMNIYYIISVTIIDFFFLVFNKYFIEYNNFIRNYYIRICVPFAITSAFVFWELVLMGKNFKRIKHGPYDICESIFLNGFEQFFLFFDMFTARHIYKYNRINDIIILTIIIAIYYLLLSIGKYLYIYEPYEFMNRSDVRQIIGSGIIVYILLLNGYIVFDLLAFYFFEKENDIIIYSIIDENKNNITSIQTLSTYDKSLTNQSNIFMFKTQLKESNIPNEITELNNNDKINNNNN